MNSNAAELLYLADQQAHARTRYSEDDTGLIRESKVIEWALRQAALRASAAPEEGMHKITVEGCSIVDDDERRTIAKLAMWNGTIDEIHEIVARANSALPSDSGKAAPDARNIARIIKRFIDDTDRSTFEVARSDAIKLVDAVLALAPATEDGGREGQSGIVVTDEMLDAHLKACGEYLETFAAPRESGVALDADFTQEDCDQLNAEARVRLRIGYLAALSPSPSVGTGTQPISSAGHQAPLPPAWLGDEGGGP